MGSISDILVVVGLGSLALMWVMIVIMVLDTAWDTVGEHLLRIIQKIKRKLDL